MSQEVRLDSPLSFVSSYITLDLKASRVKWENTVKFILVWKEVSRRGRTFAFLPYLPHWVNWGTRWNTMRGWEISTQKRTRASPKPASPRAYFLSHLSASGLGTSLTGLGVLIGVPLGVVGGLFGLTSVACSAGAKKLTLGLSKHDQTVALAKGKVSTVSDLVSKALTDGQISDTEFSLVLNEIGKYEKHKAAIRRKWGSVVLTKKEPHTEDLARGESKARTRAVDHERNDADCTSLVLPRIGDVLFSNWKRGCALGVKANGRNRRRWLLIRQECGDGRKGRKGLWVRRRLFRKRVHTQGFRGSKTEYKTINLRRSDGRKVIVKTTNTRLPRPKKGKRLLQHEKRPTNFR